MKKLLGVLLGVVLFAASTFADVTVSNNGIGVGRSEKLNFVGSTVSRNGLTTTISSSGVTPGGSGSQIQYKNGSALGGITGSGTDSNGNVGIGSSAPSQSLDVQGTARATGFITNTLAPSSMAITVTCNSCSSSFGNPAGTYYFQGYDFYNNVNNSYGYYPYYVGPNGLAISYNNAFEVWVLTASKGNATGGNWVSGTNDSVNVPLTTWSGNGGPTGTVTIARASLAPSIKLDGSYNTLAGNVSIGTDDNSSTLVVNGGIKSFNSTSNFGSTPPQYEGFVATNGLLPTDYLSNTQMMSRSSHFSTQKINAIKIVVPNWYMNTSTYVETGTGSTASVTAAVEYPSGTYTRITFNGINTASIPSGGTVTSDYVNIAIPQNTQFWIRMYVTNSGGIVYQGYSPTTALGGGSNIGNSGISDLTTTAGSISSSNSNFSPFAIIGYTNNPSILIIGDSRCQGAQDTVTDSTGNYGDITKSFGFNYGYVKDCQGGYPLSKYVASNTEQLKLYKYASHIINAFGYNDIWKNLASVSLISKFSNNLADIAHGMNKKFYNITIGPDTDSTDNWATLVNQTVHNSSNNTNRLAYNVLVRTAALTQDGYFDISSVNESSLNSGLWQVNGSSQWATIDGIHESSQGNQNIAASGVISSIFANAPTIRNGNNVGIGTSIPGGTLDVEGTINPAVFFANGATPLQNVGIGTAIPGAVLDVNGTVRSSSFTAGQALCAKGDKSIGKCTSVVGAGGACTCS